MSEFEKRERERNEARQGTPEEQIEKYTQKWLELWKKSQTKGRELDDNVIATISNPGAIPLKKWQDYLEGKVGTEDMYEVEATLQMMEEIAINGDIHKALEIFDELYVSTTDLDRIQHDVLENLPSIPEQAPDREKRFLASKEFEARANEKAHMERHAINREDNLWLVKENNMSEFEKRERERNVANQGTPEEQIEKYTQKWLELWKKSQTKGRDLDDDVIATISNPGAIPLKKWQDYLEDKVGTEDMYEVEATLQMMEEIAINGDIHKALEIFDELYVSTTDLDRVQHDVLENLPSIPQQAPDREKRFLASKEFETRANEKAHMERYAYKRELRHIR